ncbi:MAG: DUF421 domain-containing protein [Methylobacterium frigidaeris]
MEWVDAVFGTTGHVGWGQEAARAVVVFVYGLTLVRVAGRRVFGKWSALDIVVSVIVGSNLSRALTGGADLIGTLLATTLLMVLHGILARLAARSERLSRLIEGAPIVIASGGRLHEPARGREAISTADLGEALRQSGIEDVGQTRVVVLEPSGRINVLKAS